MEYILTLFVIIVVYFILGQPALPLILFVFWGVEAVAILFLLFFLGAWLALLFSRKETATFLGIRAAGLGIPYAFYEVDGKPCKNIFPTDRIWERKLYTKEQAIIRVFRGKKKVVVWDKVTLYIVGLGILAFGSIAYLVFYLIQML